MKHVSDFPADTKWIQCGAQGAIAVIQTKEEPWPRVYHMVNGTVAELRPIRVEQYDGPMGEGNERATT
jgi:hypothetical protein